MAYYPHIENLIKSKNLKISERVFPEGFKLPKYTLKGEWSREPDKAQWVDSETDLDCLIVRNRFGALCGYVGVPENHKYFGKKYDFFYSEVHGGLTFSGGCRHNICHTAEEGRPSKVWWLGFDCSHPSDYAPAQDFSTNISRIVTEGISFSTRDKYKNFDYVIKEVEKLAKEIKEDKDFFVGSSLWEDSEDE